MHEKVSITIEALHVTLLDSLVIVHRIDELTKYPNDWQILYDRYTIIPNNNINTI